MTRENPRISINALTKFLTSSDPAQRRKIVMEQIDPDGFRTAYYQCAANCIARFVVDGMHDEFMLEKEIGRLRALPFKNSNELRRYTSNAQAIERFLNFYKSLDLRNYESTLGGYDQPKMLVSKLPVSIRPEIILNSNSKGLRSTGAIKLYFSKDYRLDETRSVYPTTLLKQYLREIYPSSNIPLRQSIIVDVFGKEWFVAPKAHVRTMKIIVEGCREYQALWHLEQSEKSRNRDAA